MVSVSEANSLFVRLESGSNVGNALTLRTRMSEDVRRMFKAPIARRPAVHASHAAAGTLTLAELRCRPRL